MEIRNGNGNHRDVEGVEVGVGVMRGWDLAPSMSGIHRITADPLQITASVESEPCNNKFFMAVASRLSVSILGCCTAHRLLTVTDRTINVLAVHASNTQWVGTQLRSTPSIIHPTSYS